MDTKIIEGVFYFPLQPILTTGGKVLHAIKGIDQHLPDFGECYFSTCDTNSPKAWKRHSRMICNLFVPMGKVQFVFYDDRPDSKDFKRIAKFELSFENYGRLVIYPGIWFGFSGIGEGESLIVNVANIKHEPGESQRLEPADSSIPYTWKFDCA